MSDNAQMDAIKRYARLIEKQTGKAVRPYRMDGYVNLMNRYGTSKDPSEHYHFQREPDIPDDVLTTIYEGNGLFAKIIDTPAEEAIKHGFTLRDVSDKAVEEFVTEALDELDWEELAMTAIRWTRLFGGAIAVMLINDGGRLEDPLNWRKIKSIDDIRVYERVVVQPEYESMFNYDPTDPFSTRGSRLGMPEYYQVCSRYGNFRVHDSRCLVFQNGVLPENATNSLYRLWGIPEYIRIHRALKDAELAHESAPKLLDRSVQAIYKMKGLSQLMATEQGESQVLRRLQVIDMARGMLNSLVIDSEGEDYDFKTFQFNGITDVVSASCNMLSAITSIPQTILFGQGVGGLSTTDDTSMENYYNYIERIQKRMLRKNLRYLLSIIFQAGLYTGEVDEVPKLNVEFNPLWSLNDTEQATLEQQKAATELTKAQTAQAYIQMEAIDPSEVRKGLADSDEFDVETLLDELDDGEEDLFSDMPDMEGGAGSQNPPENGTGPQKIFEPGHFADYAEGVDVKEHDTDPGKNGSPTPASAPAATKLPQDMSDEEKLKAAEAPTNPAKKPAINAQGDGNTTSLPDDEKAGVGVLVIKDGKVLVGTRESESGYGLICGPGGHIKIGETPTQAAFRETEEEFGISPTELIPIGRGPAEPDTGIKPYVFLCTEYHGDLHCVDGEMKDPKFISLEEIEQLKPSLFQPFSDGVDVLKAIINNDDPDPDGPDHDDGGEGSGNFNHKGRPGEVGGSAESHQLGGLKNGELSSKMKSVLSGAKVGTHFSVQVNGPAGKEAYEVYKTTDGYYLRGKNGSNRVCPTDVDAVEHLGVYVNERTENKVMYKQADIQIGEPETDEAKKFTSDYEAFKKSKERLQSGEAQFAEVSDDVAKQYADTLNKASKSKIVKMAEQDPAFKEVVDNISAYTQGEYVFQRKVAEGVINNGYDAGKDQILGDRLTDSIFSCKDMYKGQNLSVSSASVAEGMANLTKAVNKSEPFEGEIYRVAQDTGIYSYASDGNQSVYVPPTVGETIKITAPTSFSKDQGAVDKIAKNKSGDIIYYTVEPGAHAVDVSKLSPYKQAELLSCGEYEVVKVESENRTYLGETTDKYTQEVLETLQKTRGATVSNGYIKVPVLTTHITLRQKETGNTDSADDDTRYYRPDDFCDRMILDGGPGSGNHGHKGVEGQVGGSAPSGDDPLTARGPIKDRLKKLGHSQESIDRARTLFDKHSGNSGSDQVEADAEIAKHISDDDDIGKMLKDKAQMESQVWRDQIADANVKAKQHYEEELDDIRQMIQPGGALSNYTEDDLKDLGMWPKEPEATEPKFYRKGGMDKDVLSFTTDPNGANMSHLTNGESGSIGSDQQFTLDQMKEMGYLPIAGIQSMDVGQVGESEVLFAKFPSSKAQVAPYAGETSHGLDESVYSAKKSEWSKNAGRELSDREVQEMVDAASDYTRNYKDVVAASAGYSGVYATRGSLMDSEEKAAAEKSAAAIEKAISLSDKYAGTTKRAMTMDKDAFDKFIAESSGDSTFGLGHLSSWSTGDDALKRVFRSRDGDDPDSYNVVLECKSKSGVSIKDVADVDMDEVLYSKKARFKVLDTDPDYSVGKYKAVKLTLEEV